MTFDPPVFEHKAVFLQRIGDYVRTGHVHWTSGEVSLDKAAALARKFDRLYAVGRSRHQRAWARQRGEASAVWLLWRRSQRPSLETLQPSVKPLSPSADGLQTAAQAGQTAVTPEQTLVWVLLVTQGEHLAHRLETLRDARTAAGRLVFETLELVALPRAGQAQPSWTWRLSDAGVQGWRALLIDCARRQPWRLGFEVQQLARLPGFAGCRAQVKKLMRLARAEHRRRCPSQPALVCPRQPYVQRLADAGVRLGALLRTERRHNQRH
jgi:hypothetical protein